MVSTSSIPASSMGPGSRLPGGRRRPAQDGAGLGKTGPGSDPAADIDVGPASPIAPETMFAILEMAAVRGREARYLDAEADGDEESAAQPGKAYASETAPRAERGSTALVVYKPPGAGGREGDPEVWWFEPLKQVGTAVGDWLGFDRIGGLVRRVASALAAAPERPAEAAAPPARSVEMLVAEPVTRRLAGRGKRSGPAVIDGTAVVLGEGQSSDEMPHAGTGGAAPL